jgi:hypothetical protein
MLFNFKRSLPSPISFNQPPLELSPCALMATVGFGNRGSPISFSFLSFSLLDLHRFIIHSFSSLSLSLVTMWFIGLITGDRLVLVEGAWWLEMVWLICGGF